MSGRPRTVLKWEVSVRSTGKSRVWLCRNMQVTVIAKVQHELLCGIFFNHTHTESPNREKINNELPVLNFPSFSQPFFFFLTRSVPLR